MKPMILRLTATLCFAVPLAAMAGPVSAPTRIPAGPAAAAMHSNMAAPSTAHMPAASVHSQPQATTVRSPAHTTGQPNVSCESAGAVTPGHAATAPGSAFNPDGKAGTVYAGEQDQNSRNTASVSQYDAGCFGGRR